MARTKQLNIVLRFSKTPYVINDLGAAKSPRFELYNESSKTVKAKSDNPRDFDELVWKEEENVQLSETDQDYERKRRKRTKRT